MGLVQSRYDKDTKIEAPRKNGRIWMAEVEPTLRAWLSFQRYQIVIKLCYIASPWYEFNKIQFWWLYSGSLRLAPALKNAHLVHVRFRFLWLVFYAKSCINWYKRYSQDTPAYPGVSFDVWLSSWDHQHPFPSKKLGGGTFYTLLMIAAQFANLRTATLRKKWVPPRCSARGVCPRGA